MSDGRFGCESGRRRVSVTMGTIFHRTRTPVTVGFAVAGSMTAAKKGGSAKTLQHWLGFGSYPTAWTMLHRFRTAMVRLARDGWSGEVEVDATRVGGEAQEGQRGRGAGRKTRVAVAVEVLSPQGFGRRRRRWVPDAPGASWVPFVCDAVASGATIMTDGWSGYHELAVHGFTHQRTIISHGDDPAHVSMPGVHRVAALLKRWLLGTQQGAVESDHLQGSLDEFTFRFNRRHSASRGRLFRRLLEQAVQTRALTYRARVAKPAPKSLPPRPLSVHRVHPTALAVTSSARPWRDYNR